MTPFKVTRTATRLSIPLSLSWNCCLIHSLVSLLLRRSLCARQCRDVESARLWKQPCAQTRLVEALKLYSAGLPHHHPPSFSQLASGVPARMD